MSIDSGKQEAIFKVLVNREEHYSLWPVDLPVPCGWTDTGHHGPRCECDRFVSAH